VHWKELQAVLRSKDNKIQHKIRFNINNNCFFEVHYKNVVRLGLGVIVFVTHVFRNNDDNDRNINVEYCM